MTLTARGSPRAAASRSRCRSALLMARAGRPVDSGRESTRDPPVLCASRVRAPAAAVAISVREKNSRLRETGQGIPSCGSASQCISRRQAPCARLCDKSATFVCFLRNALWVASSGCQGRFVLPHKRTRLPRASRLKSIRDQAVNRSLTESSKERRETDHQKALDSIGRPLCRQSLQRKMDPCKSKICITPPSGY